MPEVHDPKTGSTFALENARKYLPMYPRAYVVQTGPVVDDWKVAVSAEVSRFPTPQEIRGYDPFDYGAPLKGESLLGNTPYRSAP